jgi:hypothetical protein
MWGCDPVGQQVYGGLIFHHDECTVLKILSEMKTSLGEPTLRHFFSNGTRERERERK